MRKLVTALVLLPLLAVGGAAIYFYGLHPKARAAPEVEASRDIETYDRGRYLANHVLGCVACHSPVDEERPGGFIIKEALLSGREFPVVPDMVPRRLVAPNLTPDVETGIGAWTDGELMRAIREGVSRDGQPLFPMMNHPQFRHLTDEDTLAVIAYLRSAPPVHTKHPSTGIDFPASMFLRTAPAPVTAPPPQWPTEPVARGMLLLEIMGCADCHTPTEGGKPVDGMEFAGGNRFTGPFGTVYAANLTSDPAEGVGAYSDEDLMRVFREGKSKNGEYLWVMPWSVTQGATDGDLKALIAALRSLAPNPNIVPARSLNAGYEDWAPRESTLEPTE